jgi:hypothetical protein
MSSHYNVVAAIRTQHWSCRNPGSKHRHPAQDVKVQEIAKGTHGRPMKTREVNVPMKLTDNPNDVQEKTGKMHRERRRGGNPTGILLGGVAWYARLLLITPPLTYAPGRLESEWLFVTRLAVCKLLLTSATGAPISAPASPDCSPECSGVPALEIRSDTSRVILA